MLDSTIRTDGRQGLALGRDFPHGLDVIREERRLRAEEPLIPLQSCCKVRHRDAREQVNCHPQILVWYRNTEYD
jgi:hypothetical protein